MRGQPRRCPSDEERVAMVSTQEEVDWSEGQDRPRLVGAGGRCGVRNGGPREAWEGGRSQTYQFMGHSRESGFYAMRTGKSPGVLVGTRRVVPFIFQ